MALRGDRLKTQREKLGLTLEELSERVKVHARQLSRYEHDESDPTADVLGRLAQELRVSSDYLLGLVDDPHANLTENDLSPMEKRLIAAVRDGLISETFETLTVLTKRRDHTDVPPNQPAVNS